jgi:hypothetical protein
MFRRHWKATEKRLRELRAKEDKRKQDAFLEQVYKERMAEQTEDDDENNSEWDPIDDVLEDNQGNFIGTLWIISSRSRLVPAKDATVFTQLENGSVAY